MTGAPRRRIDDDLLFYVSLSAPLLVVCVMLLIKPIGGA